MKIGRNLFISALLICSLSAESSGAPETSFNKAKDLLLAQYDLANDEDDIHALAALGCVLTNPEWSDISVYGVLGSSSHNQGKPETKLSPTDLFDAVFGHGPTNESWTDRHADDSVSIIRVAHLVQKTVQAGGRVFVAEAGHYPFTHSWVDYLIREGMLTRELIKQRVIVVQHSQGNIDRSAGDSYRRVVASTTHQKIPDGNRPFGSNDPSFMETATSDENPNRVARSLWRMADNYIHDTEHGGISNKRILQKGIDFSDFIEVRWILDLQRIEDAQGFWNEYVTKDLSTQ